MTYPNDAPGDAPPSLSSGGPPCGVHLIAYATISADLAEGDRPESEVLAAHGLNADDFTRVTLFWSARMAEDAQARGADAKVPQLFSEAFARAQDQKRAAPHFTVEEWAALTEELAGAESLERGLEGRRLTAADYLRATRLWARALAADPDLHARFEAARDAWILAFGDRDPG